MSASERSSAPITLAATPALPADPAEFHPRVLFAREIPLYPLSGRFQHPANRSDPVFAMSTAPLVFSPTGAIQTHSVTMAGTYLIEAAGAQGGAGASPGIKGSRVSGMFYLKPGDLLKIVAGSQGTPADPPHQPSGGRGGSSLVWTGDSDLPQPIKLMLSARGGDGGGPAEARQAGEAPTPAGNGERGAAAEADKLDASAAGLDQHTLDTLETQWTRGSDAGAPGTARGAGRLDHGGYSAGAFRTCTAQFQAGDGYVSLTPVSVPASAGAKGQPTAPTPAAATGGGGSGSESETSSAAASLDGVEAPSQSNLPEVSPRLKSWEKLLRRHRRS